MRSVPLLLIAIIVIVAGRFAGAVVHQLIIFVVETVIEIVSFLAAFTNRIEFVALSTIGSRVKRAVVFDLFHSCRMFYP